MFLHLGSEAIVKKKDIVAIFDMDNTTVSRASREFLAKAQENNIVVNVSEELPKSYIVTKTGTQVRVYISSISTATLLKRSKGKNTLGI